MSKNPYANESIAQMKPIWVICISNKGYPASLIRHKIYQAKQDDVLPLHSGMFRIVSDETGESYLYPYSLFLPIQLSDEILKAIINSPFGDV
jgi:hypothetical protein